MSDEVKRETAPETAPPIETTEAAKAESPTAAVEAKPASKPASQSAPRSGQPQGGGQQQQGGKPRQGDRPQGGGREGDRGGRGGGPRDDRGREGRPGGGGPNRDRGGDRRFEGPPDIEIEKLMADSLYLDNHAHAIVARLRDMDSGTKSQLRRFYNAVRRACRAPEGSRQHEFVMLRARLAYTIARHSLRSLDGLERLLLQVTRKNDAKGYERFRDLFEAIVAYNE